MVGTCNVYRFLLHGHWKNRILMFNGIRLGDHSGCGCVSVISPMSSLFFFVTAGHIWGFPTMGDPQNCWFIMGNPILTRGTPIISGNLHFPGPESVWLNPKIPWFFAKSVSPSINDNKRMYHPIVPNCSTTLLVDYTHLPTWISWILIRLIPINPIQNPILNPSIPIQNPIKKSHLQRPHSENPIPKIPSIFELNPPVGSSQLDLDRWFSSISINWWYIYIYILIYGTIWFSYGFPIKRPKKNTTESLSLKTEPRRSRRLLRRRRPSCAHSRSGDLAIFSLGEKQRVLAEGLTNVSGSLFVDICGDSYGISWWFHGNLWWFGDLFLLSAMISSPNIGLRVVGDVKKTDLVSTIEIHLGFPFI